MCLWHPPTTVVYPLTTTSIISHTASDYTVISQTAATTMTTTIAITATTCCCFVDNEQRLWWPQVTTTTPPNPNEMWVVHLVLLTPHFNLSTTHHYRFADGWPQPPPTTIILQMDEQHLLSPSSPSIWDVRCSFGVSTTVFNPHHLF